jgi:hypothetical protein
MEQIQTDMWLCERDLQYIQILREVKATVRLVDSHRSVAALLQLCCSVDSHCSVAALLQR